MALIGTPDPHRGLNPGVDTQSTHRSRPRAVCHPWEMGRWNHTQHTVPGSKSNTTHKIKTKPIINHFQIENHNYLCVVMGRGVARHAVLHKSLTVNALTNYLNANETINQTQQTDISLHFIAAASLW